MIVVLSEELSSVCPIKAPVRKVSGVSHDPKRTLNGDALCGVDVCVDIVVVWNYHIFEVDSRRGDGSDGSFDSQECRTPERQESNTSDCSKAEAGEMKWKFMHLDFLIIKRARVKSRGVAMRSRETGLLVDQVANDFDDVRLGMVQGDADFC